MKDYKRLTERDEFGNADIIGVGSEILASTLDFDELNKLTFALNKFADLEDKIESGELVVRNEYYGSKRYIGNDGQGNPVLCKAQCESTRKYDGRNRPSDRRKRRTPSKAFQNGNG